MSIGIDSSAGGGVVEGRVLLLAVGVCSECGVLLNTWIGSGVCWGGVSEGLACGGIASRGRKILSLTGYRLAGQCLADTCWICRILGSDSSRKR